MIAGESVSKHSWLSEQAFEGTSSPGLHVQGVRMDRLGTELDREQSSFPAEESLDGPGLYSARQLREAELRLAIPEALFALDELDVFYESASQTLWSYMRPSGRPCFSPAMLGDFESWQSLIGNAFGTGKVPLKFLVLGSRAPGVFCFGGDLALFHRLIQEQNRAALVQYGNRCVEILHRNIHALDLPILTVGLVEGTALGGGFEALLSFDFVIAERGCTFGLPEVMFGLFPGMGAHAILSRKLGTAQADRVILSNETYTAEQMYELGIVHELAEPGEGLSATRAFIARNARRHAGVVGARKATRIASPVPLEEMHQIVELWADSALQLRDQDLRVMNRLANAQTRRRAAS